MTASDDEYDVLAGGPLELSEEDWDRIDAICAEHTQQPLRLPLEHVPVVLEDALIVADDTSPLVVLPKSPYQRCRSWGNRLAVTDLVGPLW